MNIVSISVINSLGTWKGKEEQVTDKELEEIVGLAEKIGKLTYLKLEDDTGSTLIFPRAIIENSVIHVNVRKVSNV